MSVANPISLHISAAREKISPLVVLYLISWALGFVGSLAIQLPNLRLQEAGVSNTLIGLSTSCQAIGIIVGALASLPLMRLAGSAAIIGGASVLVGASLFALSAINDWPTVSALRFVMALGSGALLASSEFILVARAPLNRRATFLAIYAVFSLLGQMFGPGVISVTGTSPTPLAITGLCMMLFCFAPYLMGIRRRVDAQEPGAGASLKMLMMVPVAFIPAFAFGLLDGGLLELLNLHWVGQGFSIPLASAMAGVAAAGALFLQLPVAALSDRVGHEVMLRFVWGGIALMLIVAGSNAPLWALLLASFALGGLCDALYSIGFSSLASQLPTARLATANAGFVAMCGLGEVVGPAIGGAALNASALLPGASAFISIFLILAIAGLFLSLRNRPAA